MSLDQNTNEIPVIDDGPDHVMQRGIAIYNEKLRALLGPSHNGEAVAIHLDTGDYMLAETSNKAMLAIRKTHPEGLLLLHIIGPGSARGLANRILGSRFLNGHQYNW